MQQHQDRATLIKFGARKSLFAATGMLKPEIQREMHQKLIELIEADKFRPVMDRTYPFDQLVEAHHYVESSRKRGNVVVV
jgi:NADPH:quinone reductase-like Zn-dependent oxidoreductase